MKFGSTWLKTALLGSAMLVMSGVFAQGTPAEGKKLTETFDEGITATYLPEIADKTKVAAGEYTVTFTVVKGKELGDVTFNGEKLTATAEKPLEFKFTMPSDKDGVLVAKVKGEAPAPTPKVKITWANDPKEGVKEMHFNKAKIEDNKLKGWEKEEVAVAAADVYYVINFVVDVDNYKYVSFAINEKNAAGTSKMTEYQLDKDIFELVNKEKKYLCHYATIAWSADEDVVECELIAKTKSKKKPSAVEDNAFAAVNVYPNPFAGKLVVNEVAEASRVTLVNAQGVVLRSVAVNGANQVELDVTDVPAGIYMVVVENGAARRAFKVVK
ncbi:MAG: T9SS type A sorting domain-containing protein [Bacteroides sp.]